MAPAQTEDAFVMADGVRLPYREWLPEREPWAVVLALHGMNDSRDAWEIPAPELNAAGIAVFAPDQRGFGDTAVRGYWPGGDALAARAEAKLGVSLGNTTADDRVTLEPIYCLGLCATAPSAMLDGRVVGRLDEARIDALVAEAQR